MGFGKLNLSKILSVYKHRILNLFIYLGGSLIPMALSIMVNPYVAMNMSPDDYAIVGYYTAFNSLIIPLVNFYLIHYYTKKFFELEGDERLILKATLLKALIYFSFIISFLAIIILFIYHYYFNRDSQIPFVPYALLAILSLPLTGIFTLMLADYRMKRESFSFFKFSVLNGLLSVGLTIALVVIFKYGAAGKLGAVFIGNFIVFLYCVYLNRNLLTWRFQFPIFKRSLLFCFPLVMAAMLSFFSNGFDKILLERMGSIEDLGYYVVGAQIAGFLTVFSSSIDNTFQPDIFKNVVEKNYGKCLKVVGVKTALLLLIVLVFVLLAEWMVDILTAGRYTRSTPYVIILSLSAITSMIYHSFSQVTIAMGLTKITLLNKIIGSVACVGLFLFFIDKWEATGAAWAVVLSFVIYFLGNVVLVLLHNNKLKNRLSSSI